jgi:hypothetical protein
MLRPDDNLGSHLVRFPVTITWLPWLGERALAYAKATSQTVADFLGLE